MRSVHGFIVDRNVQQGEGFCCMAFHVRGGKIRQPHGNEDTRGAVESFFYEMKSSHEAYQRDPQSKDDHIATKIDDDENLVDALLKIQKSENQPTRDNIKAVIWVRPGEKEISNNLDWAISEMLKNPSVLQKAQQRSKQVFSAYGYVDETYFDELKYLRSVILKTCLSAYQNLSMKKRGESRKLASKYSTKKSLEKWPVQKDIKATCPLCRTVYLRK
ncbi:hypothetical protein RND71_016168 [Anisodus tanguticus]|uniref:Uncharacterized protein n=1 Tax=Anisodus tanguticus TaxID=243964 RepID=A0AAE1VLY1_9SOLA|nr:hypothetical protein RND71_016168 [Anisodus tanguticus]